MILNSEIENGGWAGGVPAAGYGSIASSVTNVQIDYVRAYSAVPVPEPAADFDFDGEVDGADFLTWQWAAGTLTGGARADGNANAGEDGDVNDDDLAVWRQQFGTSSPVLQAVDAVPEPTSWAIAAWLLIIAGSRGKESAKRC